ncbi:UMP kinase [Thiorhodococcus mannitoliphagus]|uniref:Uridylate kinase n=1 Tax=Thiorhodococcus mannitoliphagus TaxID=329406 RepID=A0A6P1DTS6_9GAMM|nr:UMP kinase [Thiorhodococcus mannitoliphagus]NEX20361.1 UMP kinase [Thiorhodococcus mannitoliphagus]
MTALVYRRILLKLSGEALMGEGTHGIDPDVLERFAHEVQALVEAGSQVALVIGGGNIFRGAGLAARGMERVTGDHMGMLATVMNALAMQDALERLGLAAPVMSALQIDQVCEGYGRRRAIKHLECGRVVIFAGGTGNPLFTTDSAASLRAIEVGADVLIKATKVDGVYSADPVTDPTATFYPRLSYDQVLQQDLRVMDTTAIVLCRDHAMPLRVMNINETGALLRLIRGEDVGSLVVSES